MRIVACSITSSVLALAACPAGKAAQTVEPSQPTVGDADPSMDREVMRHARASGVSRARTAR